MQVMYLLYGRGYEEAVHDIAELEMNKQFRERMKVCAQVCGVVWYLCVGICVGVLYACCLCVACVLYVLYVLYVCCMCVVYVLYVCVLCADVASQYITQSLHRMLKTVAVRSQSYGRF